MKNRLKRSMAGLLAVAMMGTFNIGMPVVTVAAEENSEANEEVLNLFNLLHTKNSLDTLVLDYSLPYFSITEGDVVHVNNTELATTYVDNKQGLSNAEIKEKYWLDPVEGTYADFTAKAYNVEQYMKGRITESEGYDALYTTLHSNLIIMRAAYRDYFTQYNLTGLADSLYSSVYDEIIAIENTEFATKKGEETNQNLKADSDLFDEIQGATININKYSHTVPEYILLTFAQYTSQLRQLEGVDTKIFTDTSITDEQAVDAMLKEMTMQDAITLYCSLYNHVSTLDNFSKELNETYAIDTVGDNTENMTYVAWCNYAANKLSTVETMDTAELCNHYKHLASTLEDIINDDNYVFDSSVLSDVKQITDNNFDSNFAPKGDLQAFVNYAKTIRYDMPMELRRAWVSLYAVPEEMQSLICALNAADFEEYYDSRQNTLDGAWDFNATKYNVAKYTTSFAKAETGESYLEKTLLKDADGNTQQYARQSEITPWINLESVYTDGLYNLDMVRNNSNLSSNDYNPKHPMKYTVTDSPDMLTYLKEYGYTPTEDVAFDLKDVTIVVDRIAMDDMGTPAYDIYEAKLMGDLTTNLSVPAILEKVKKAEFNSVDPTLVSDFVKEVRAIYPYITSEKLDNYIEIFKGQQSGWNMHNGYSISFKFNYNTNVALNTTDENSSALSKQHLLLMEIPEYALSEYYEDFDSLPNTSEIKTVALQTVKQQLKDYTQFVLDHRESYDYANSTIKPAWADYLARGKVNKTRNSEGTLSTVPLNTVINVPNYVPVFGRSFDTRFFVNYSRSGLGTKGFVISANNTMLNDTQFTQGAINLNPDLRFVDLSNYYTTVYSQHYADICYDITQRVYSPIQQYTSEEFNSKTTQGGNAVNSNDGTMRIYYKSESVPTLMWDKLTGSIITQESNKSDYAPEYYMWLSKNTTDDGIYIADWINSTPEILKKNFKATNTVNYNNEQKYSINKSSRMQAGETTKIVLTPGSRKGSFSDWCFGKKLSEEPSKIFYCPETKTAVYDCNAHNNAYIYLQYYDQGIQTYLDVGEPPTSRHNSSSSAIKTAPITRNSLSNILSGSLTVNMSNAKSQWNNGGDTLDGNATDIHHNTWDTHYMQPFNNDTNTAFSDDQNYEKIIKGIADGTFEPKDPSNTQQGYSGTGINGATWTFSQAYIYTDPNTGAVEIIATNLTDAQSIQKLMEQNGELLPETQVDCHGLGEYTDANPDGLNTVWSSSRTTKEETSKPKPPQTYVRPTPTRDDPPPEPSIVWHKDLINLKRTYVPIYLWTCTAGSGSLLNGLPASLELEGLGTVSTTPKEVIPSTSSSSSTSSDSNTLRYVGSSANPFNQNLYDEYKAELERRYYAIASWKLTSAQTSFYYKADEQKAALQSLLNSQSSYNTGEVKASSLSGLSGLLASTYGGSLLSNNSSNRKPVTATIQAKTTSNTTVSLARLRVLCWNTPKAWLVYLNNLTTASDSNSDAVKDTTDYNKATMGTFDITNPIPGASRVAALPSNTPMGMVLDGGYNEQMVMQSSGTVTINLPQITYVPFMFVNNATKDIVQTNGKDTYTITPESRVVSKTILGEDLSATTHRTEVYDNAQTEKLVPEVLMTYKDSFADSLGNLLTQTDRGKLHSVYVAAYNMYTMDLPAYHRVTIDYATEMTETVSAASASTPKAKALGGTKSVLYTGTEVNALYNIGADKKNNVNFTSYVLDFGSNKTVGSAWNQNYTKEGSKQAAQAWLNTFKSSANNTDTAPFEVEATLSATYDTSAVYANTSNSVRATATSTKIVDGRKMEPVEVTQKYQFDLGDNKYDTFTEYPITIRNGRLSTVTANNVVYNLYGKGDCNTTKQLMTSTGFAQLKSAEPELAEAIANMKLAEFAATLVHNGGIDNWESYKDVSIYKDNSGKTVPETVSTEKSKYNTDFLLADTKDNWYAEDTTVLSIKKFEIEGALPAELGFSYKVPLDYGYKSPVNKTDLFKAGTAVYAYQELFFEFPNTVAVTTGTDMKSGSFDIIGDEITGDCKVTPEPVYVISNATVNDMR